MGNVERDGCCLRRFIRGLTQREGRKSTLLYGVAPGDLVENKLGERERERGVGVGVDLFLGM